MENLSKKLKLLRSKKGVMQKDVATGLGITPTSYSYYESGKRMPSADILKKIAEYYEVPVEYFFDEINNSDKDYYERFRTVEENHKKINGKPIGNPAIRCQRKVNPSNLIKFLYDFVEDENLLSYNYTEHNEISKYIVDSDIAYPIDEELIHCNPVSKGLIKKPTEFNQKAIYDALNLLLTYANKCTTPDLTDRQFDMMFDKTVDYIKYQLYQLDRE